MAKLVTGTYGEALYEYAVSEKKEKMLLEEVIQLKEVFKKNPEFLDMMNHPKITKDEKKEALKNVFDTFASTDLTSFCTLVLQKDRFSEISGILDFFIARMKEYLKIGTATVTTAVSLKDSQKKDIEKKLLDTTSYETMEIKYELDSSLIGGMKIRIGDRVVDSSIKTKLEKLTKELSEVQIARK